MSTPSFGKLHNRLDEIIGELNNLRVVLWNAYAEESRHPKSKVSVFIVNVSHDDGEEIIGAYTSKSKAEFAINDYMIGGPRDRVEHEYWIDEVHLDD